MDTQQKREKFVPIEHLSPCKRCDTKECGWYQTHAGKWMLCEASMRGEQLSVNVFARHRCPTKKAEDGGAVLSGSQPQDAALAQATEDVANLAASFVSVWEPTIAELMQGYDVTADLSALNMAIAKRRILQGKRGAR